MLTKEELEIVTQCLGRDEEYAYLLVETIEKAMQRKYGLVAQTTGEGYLELQESKPGGS